MSGDPGRTPDHSPSTTRRNLLAGSAVLAAAGAVAAVPALAAGTGDDAELIGLCDRVKGLDAAIRAHYAERHRLYLADDGRYTAEFEESYNSQFIYYPLEDEWSDLVGEITDLPARALPRGFGARLKF